MRIPRRLMGYGAYNLCFDNQLGAAPSTGNKDFFQFLHDGQWHVNLVKVILFRNSMQEGLTADRAIPLYLKGQLNDAFFTNLQTLARRAQETGVWVQVCLFSYHSVARREGPEKAPPEIDPLQIAGDSYTRLVKWFDPRPPDDTGRTRMQLQYALITRAAQALKGYGNILWELVNEVRIDGINDFNVMQQGDCRLTEWLKLMRQQLIASVASTPQSPYYISTSTGSYKNETKPAPSAANEQITFSSTPTCQGAAPLAAEFFDFHSGQWDQSEAGMDAALTRAKGYNPSAPLIINDDGTDIGDDTSAAAAATVGRWAGAAFARGLSYSSKQHYPPSKTFNKLVLDQMHNAWQSHPLYTPQ